MKKSFNILDRGNTIDYLEFDLFELLVISDPKYWIATEDKIIGYLFEEYNTAFEIYQICKN